MYLGISSSGWRLTAVATIPVDRMFLSLLVEFFFFFGGGGGGGGGNFYGQGRKMLPYCAHCPIVWQGRPYTHTPFRMD